MNRVALLAVVTAFLVTEGSAQDRERLNRQDDSLAETSDELQGGFKLCSVVIPDRWRDSIEAPLAWRPAECREFARSVGAAFFQLGCVFESRSFPFSWGQVRGIDERAGGRSLFPDPNCGWRRGGQAGE